MASTDNKDIAYWLSRIGMSQFTSAFTSNGVDFDLLPELTSQDLSEIGVPRLVDRKKILKEIRLLTLEKARNSVQRRVLSVFFCDMVGSTARSTKIDPEEYRHEMKLYQDAVVAAVNHHGGFVARFLGDGVLAYFGWPHADEDQASQAVRAGVDAIRAVGDLKFEAGFTTQCRIGIATGRVVVGGQQDLDSAFGETPNLAARLQSLADIDQIIIDSATRRAIGNRFIVDHAQKVHLKGFGDPVGVWAVVKERTHLDRFESRGGGGSVFVGRDDELNILRKAWDTALSGRGQAVFLRGDPGIGKSRLVKHFCETLLPENVEVQQFQCSSHHTNSAFHPVIQHMEAAAGIDPTRDSSSEKLAKIRARMHPEVSKDAQSVNLIARLLCVVDTELPDIVELTPQEQRKRTIEILVSNSQYRAGGGALVYILEDIHWIDPSSKLLLEFIIENFQSSPILVIITSREPCSLSLTKSDRIAEVALPRLSENSIEQLARGVDSTGVLSGAAITNIIRRADGVPLFAEEIALAAIEFGARGDSFELPESVEASLAARLDNLGEAKAAIQVASIIGREFKLPQLQALAATEDSVLLAAVGTAIASGLVQEVRSLSDRAFRFTHALVQDVAYNGLLKQQRRALHRRLAVDVLDKAVKQREPELVALHLTCSEDFTLAIDYWQKAANRSTAASANAEAIAHFQQGLRLIHKLPEDQQRDELEFGLLVGMALPLIAEKGYTSDDLERCISDALSIGKRVKYTPAIYSLLFSQWGFKLTVGLIEDSMHIANEFSTLAEKQNDKIAKYARYRMLGASHMCLGQLEKARTELGILINDYQPEQHANLVSVYGVDLRVAGRCFLSEVLWLLGQVDEAQGSAEAALSEARDLNHLHSHAMSLHFCALNAFLNRDRERIKSYIAEMMGLAEERAIGAWPTLGGAMMAWAELCDENFDEQIAALKDGVDAAEKLGVGMFIPFFYCRIAEELLAAKKIEEARHYLDNAQALMNRTAEQTFRGELLQLQAQLLLFEKKPDKAEKLFAEGLQHALGMGALSVELRVANAYCQHLLDRGNSRAAGNILQPLLKQFPSDVKSSDLKAGRRLLTKIQSAIAAAGAGSNVYDISGS